MPRGSANRVDAPLFKLPLMRSPSAAPIPAGPVSTVRLIGSSSSAESSGSNTRAAGSARVNSSNERTLSASGGGSSFRRNRNLARDGVEAEQLDRESPEAVGKRGQVVNALAVGRCRCLGLAWSLSPWRRGRAGR
jgi:hypothetical protein